MKIDCCVCHRSQELGHCEIVELSADEKVTVEKMGYKPAPDKLHYCKPCWKILNDRQQGAQLIKGFWERSLQRAGVVNAEAKAEKFRRNLLDKVKP